MSVLLYFTDMVFCVFCLYIYLVRFSVADIYIYIYLFIFLGQLKWIVSIGTVMAGNLSLVF